ncbi:MAG: S9 family peptidase [Erythrobacter sp.]
MKKTHRFAPSSLVFTTTLSAAIALGAASPALADGHAAAGNADSNHSTTPRTPMSAKDLITMPRLGSPTVSPDGRFAVYRVTETDGDTFKRTPSYYLRDLRDENAGSIPLDLGGTASSLSFGGDNFLYFLSDRANDGDVETKTAASRLWRAALEADGNVTGPMLVGDWEGTSPDGYKLAPDASKVAVWAPIARDCPTFGCEKDGEKHTPGPGTGRLYDGADGFVRHWDHWTSPGTVNRVFAFDIAGGKVIGAGTPLDGRDPKTGINANTPTMPFGGGEDIAWAPDGSGLYFTARLSDAKEPTSTNLDIYWRDLGKSAPISLTANNKAHDSQPAPSPDGKTLAYLAMERAGYESDKLTVHLRDIKSGKVRALTADFDRSFGSLSWTKDGKSLLATATDVLDTPVFKIDAKTGAIQKLDLMAGYEAHIGNVTPLGSGDILFTHDSIGAPHELFLSKSGTQARPLTDAAMSDLDSRAATVTTRFSFAGAGGDEVWGQITKLQKHKGKMPAILYIHGGPQGSFRDGWSSRWNPRLLASQGYAVISVDFHGSTGYGQEFTDSINQDWGGKPLEDLQKGLAAALASDEQIDGTRACAMGASYGGFMVNWIAGKWPDRFQCLIQHDGLFDMRSFYYATEELWFPRWDFGGSYAEVPENYEKWNPVNHVDQWQTPMLVITGEKDFRVPYTQGIQSFTALQERGIPSQLLVFPDENHWVLGAKNSLQWHNTVFSWLDRWLVEEAEEVSKAP